MKKNVSLKKAKQRVLFKFLSIIERAAPQNYRLKHPPTFIVSPPRAGSTLTRQLLAWAIPTSYFSNFTHVSTLAAGYPLPVTTAYLAKWFKDTAVSSFENYYGHINGRSAPTEGETIWGHWFKTRHEAVEPEALSVEQRHQIYNAVAATENILGQPFLNKTTTLSLRIRTLSKIFPEAIFIQVTRDPVDIAQSIYRARTKGYAYWFGGRPNECKHNEYKSIPQQVSEQVFYIEKNIAHEKAIVGQEKFISVAYRDLCANPSRELNRLVKFLRMQHVPAKLAKPIPEYFAFSHGRKVDEEVYEAIKKHVYSLYHLDNQQ